MCPAWNVLLHGPSRYLSTVSMKWNPSSIPISLLPLKNEYRPLLFWSWSRCGLSVLLAKGERLEDGRLEVEG